MRSHLVGLFLLISCLATGASGAAQTPTASTQTATADHSEKPEITLEAPEAIKPLLTQHLRIFQDKTQTARPNRMRQKILRQNTQTEVNSILKTLGYFNATSDMTFDGKQWTLTVKPGPQVKVTEVNITFSGDIASDTPAHRERRATLKKSWSLPVGKAFQQDAWAGAKQQLLDSIARQDYAAAKMTQRAVIDVKNHRAKLSISVDSGPPFFIGPIEASGFEKLPTNLVARLSSLRRGERFNQDRLLEFQRILQNSPQFSAVEVEIDRDPAKAKDAPIYVRISEADSRHLAFGVGFSTNTGARTEISWRDVNWRGRAQELSTGLRLEQRRQTLYADLFMPPAHQHHRDSFGLLAERTNIEGLKTTNFAIGATRTRIRGDIETATRLRYQRERIQPSGGKAEGLNALTANFSWTQRKVNSLVNPTRGYILEAEIGAGAKILLSDQNFIRSRARLIYFYPVGERDVFIARGELGYTAAKSRHGIPQDFLFRTGGSQSVRGYAYRSLGVSQNNATLGGRYLGVASAEYVHWFLPEWGAAAFVDVGNASDDLKRFNARIGYGIGARWRNPAIGPVAIDLAYAHEEKRFRLHFGIGVAF